MYKYILYIFIFCIPSAFAAEPDTRISGKTDWEHLRISAAITIDLRQTGITLPAGRLMAESLLFSQFQAKIAPFILAIPLDSSSTLAERIERGDIPAAAVDEIASGASRLPPAYQSGFSAMSASYTVDLAAVARLFVRHVRPLPPPSTLMPVDSPRYTGIVILAAEDLPHHGHNVKAAILPCLFPKIWDTDMNVIYEKNMVEPEVFAARTMIHYTTSAGIFQKTPSGLSPGIEKIVGNKPLRIIARGVFGASPTDPIIDRADALAIISTNRHLLQEGRVAIILPAPVLTTALAE